MRAMTIVKNLVTGDEVAAAAAEVERIRREGAAAAREVDLLEQSKLVETDFERVEEIDRAIAKQRWIIAQRSKQLVEADAELVRAKAEQRAARWQEHRREDDARLEKTFLTFAKAFEAWSDLSLGRNAMEAQGFTPEMRALTRLPNLNGNPLIAPDLMQVALAEAARSNPRLAKIEFPSGAGLAWRETVDSAAEALGLPRWRPSAPASAVQARPSQSQRRPRRPLYDDPQPSDQAQRLITVIGNTVDVPGRGTCTAGDRIAVEVELAQLMVRHGTAEYVTSGTTEAQIGAEATNG